MEDDEDTCPECGLALIPTEDGGLMCVGHLAQDEGDKDEPIQPSK